MLGRARPPWTAVAQSLLLFDQPHVLRQPARDAERRPDLAAPPRLPWRTPTSQVSDPLHSFTQQIASSGSVSHEPPPHASAVLFKGGVEPRTTRDHGPHASDMSQQQRNGIGCRLREHVQPFIQHYAGGQPSVATQQDITSDH